MPIIAALIGAFLGFVYNTKSEKKRDKKNILAVLMAYRGVKAHEDDFVKALNMVDIYYYDSKKVRRICHEYFYSLDSPIFETGQHSRILRSLILAMAIECGYKEIRESDIDHYYLPQIYIQRYGGNNDKNEP